MMSLRSNFLGILGGAIALSATFCLAERAHAVPVTVYVAKTGVAGRSRTTASSPTTPLNSIQEAVNVALNGDSIEVAPGTYNEAVTISGRSTLYLHSQSGGSKPIIKASAAQTYTVVNITGSDHITVGGFEIDGSLAGPSTNGVVITPRTVGSTVTRSNHVEIRYCLVHNAGGGGVSTVGNGVGNGDNGCDYIKVTSNEIYGCLGGGKYNGSAISLLADEDVTGTSGTHSYIQNNIVHDNVNNNRDLNSSGVIDPEKHTDGNGIIVDTTGQSGPKVLIQNNIVYRNGGRGIHIFNSSNVTVLNNSLYGDELDQYRKFTGGELEAAGAKNVFFSNNVVQGNGLCPAFTVGTGSFANSGVSFKNNTYTNCGTSAAGYIDWNTTIYSDPTWGDIFVNISTGDFHLRTLATRSPLSSAASQTALNRGSNISGEYSVNDVDYVVRNPGGTPPGGAVDRGAYER